MTKSADVAMYECMHTHDQFLNTLAIEANGVPIYVQLREQMLAAIGSGRLTAGAQMPTMRQVAVALRVDLNTVRHAYDDLERAGAVVLIRGRGSFVVDAPPRTDLNILTESLARQSLAQALTQGIDPLVLSQRIAALAAEKET